MYLPVQGPSQLTCSEKGSIAHRESTDRESLDPDAAPKARRADETSADNTFSGGRARGRYSARPERRESERREIIKEKKKTKSNREMARSFFSSHNEARGAGRCPLVIFERE